MGSGVLIPDVFHVKHPERTSSVLPDVIGHRDGRHANQDEAPVLSVELEAIGLRDRGVSAKGGAARVNGGDEGGCGFPVKHQTHIRCSGSASKPRHSGRRSRCRYLGSIPRPPSATSERPTRIRVHSRRATGTYPLPPNVLLTTYEKPLNRSFWPPVRSVRHHHPQACGRWALGADAGDRARRAQGTRD